jgi:hypothetical protein
VLVLAAKCLIHKLYLQNKYVRIAKRQQKKNHTVSIFPDGVAREISSISREPKLGKIDIRSVFLPTFHIWRSRDRRNLADVPIRDFGNCAIRLLLPLGYAHIFIL